MASLMERMAKSGHVKAKSIADSSIFAEKPIIKTDLPIINVAFSGSIDGGLVPGLTVIAGQSKTFKSLISLYCLKAFQDKYPEGIALFYDCEYGISEDYMKMVGVDPNRVLYLEIENIEQLKFDMVQKLKSVEKNDKVFILIDSIGNMASVKEVEDAINEKSVADMSRAKSLKSLFRITTPLVVKNNVYCIAINHIYMEQGLYPKAIVSGGTGIMYSANQVFIIGKSQIKSGTEIIGYDFTINIEKSRYVKEKSKLPFTVLNNAGIQKWSSMFELAEEAGFIEKPKVGWYVTVDPESGEVSETNRRKADVEKDDAFFTKLVNNAEFKKFVERKYKLTNEEIAQLDQSISMDEDEE